jgi:ubiquinone/menaquinone biosynthesis C-methylase UbiE
MKSSEELNRIVQKKYQQIANRDNASCCGGAGKGPEIYHIMNDDYSQVQGYQAEADLGLGCGLPTEFAKIRKGDLVIDLGSGAGNDCFVARNEIGETGKVVGIDFTEEMIAKARANAEKLGFNNMEFRKGDIEDLPVSDNLADVIVSNCVLNLVPNKAKVFKEIFRTLMPAGHFSISDIVLVGNLPENIKADAEMYAGCVAGAIQKHIYLKYIENAGFVNIAVQKEKPIYIPDEILDRYFDADGKENFRNGKSGIYSITVFGQKPGIKPLNAVDPLEGQKEYAGPDNTSSCC